MSQEHTEDHPHNKALAALALTASTQAQAQDCPDDEALAQYVEKRLNSEAQQHIKQHIALCDHCFERWHLVAEVNLAYQREQKVAVVEKPSLLKRFQAWFTQPMALGSGLAVASVMVLAVVLLKPLYQAEQFYSDVDALYDSAPILSQRLLGDPRSKSAGVNSPTFLAYKAGWRSTIEKLAEPLSAEERVRWQHVLDDLVDKPGCEAGDQVCRNQTKAVYAAGQWAALTYLHCHGGASVNWQPYIDVLKGFPAEFEKQPVDDNLQAIINNLASQTNLNGEILCEEIDALVP